MYCCDIDFTLYTDSISIENIINQKTASVSYVDKKPDFLNIVLIMSWRRDTPHHPMSLYSEQQPCRLDQTWGLQSALSVYLSAISATESSRRRCKWKLMKYIYLGLKPFSAPEENMCLRVKRKGLLPSLPWSSSSVPSTTSTLSSCPSYSPPRFCLIQRKTVISYNEQSTTRRKTQPRAPTTVSVPWPTWQPWWRPTKLCPGSTIPHKL